jgi:hypothetical protein
MSLPSPENWPKKVSLYFKTIRDEYPDECREGIISEGIISVYHSECVDCLKEEVIITVCLSGSPDRSSIWDRATKAVWVFEGLCVWVCLSFHGFKY